MYMSHEIPTQGFSLRNPKLWLDVVGVALGAAFMGIGVYYSNIPLVAVGFVVFILPFLLLKWIFIGFWLVGLVGKTLSPKKKD